VQHQRAVEQVGPDHVVVEPDEEHDDEEEEHIRLVHRLAWRRALDHLEEVQFRQDRASGIAH
jgi:hypothetical protein